MGFQLVFDLFEVFKKGEEMKKINFSSADEILSKSEEILGLFNAEYIETEEYNLYISYLKSSSSENKKISNDDQKTSEYFKKNPIILFEGVILFESIEKNYSAILVKQNEDIIINQGDKKLIEICEKMQILLIKQSFIIKLKKFKLGDVIFKIGSVFQIKTDKVKYTKSILLEIEIPFLNTFEESKNMIFDLVNNIFYYDYLEEVKKKQELNEEKFHFYEDFLEKVLKERNNINSHWNLLQYTNVILHDTQSKLNLFK